MNGTFIRNLETGKVELRFAKTDYLALPDSDKSNLKSACLFSGRLGCWISRATNNPWRSVEVAKALGLTDEGETGERLSFAEQQAAKVERAEERAERMEKHTENAEHRAAIAFERADLSESKSGIPLGQPILVGHHSERRHRRALERADNAMRRGIEESDKAKYFAQRAASAKYTASQADLQDKRYLQNRIDENAAQIRDVDRRLAEQEVISQTDEQAQAYKIRLTALRAEYVEKFDYFQAAMDALGGVSYSKENVKPGDCVRIRGRWETVVKANGKTVAVTCCFPCPLKYPWAEVQEHKPAPLVAA